MAAPPSVAGAVNAMRACWLPGVDAPITGAEGAETATVKLCDTCGAAL